MRSNSHVVLGSASPRRRRLLQIAGFSVEVIVSGVDETSPNGADPASSAIAIAERKLAALPPEKTPCLTADTLVVLDGELLGKPDDHDSAAAMLKRLSGKKHEVVTGFCIRFGDGRVIAEAVSTNVWFRELSTQEIRNYVETREPLDKAGSYGIQGAGGALVDRLEGSYTNVVGLPLAEVIRALEGVQ